MSRDAFDTYELDYLEAEERREQAAMERYRLDTLCWSCNHVYLRIEPVCPACGKINGLVDLAGAGRQMREMT